MLVVHTCTSLILHPTRITDHSATRLITFSSIRYLSIAIPSEVTLYIISLIIVKILRISYSQFDQRGTLKIQNKIQSTDRVHAQCFNHSTKKNSSSTDKYQSIINLEGIELKLKSMPWITSTLRKCIKVQND